MVICPDETRHSHVATPIHILHTLYNPLPSIMSAAKIQKVLARQKTKYTTYRILVYVAAC